MSEMKSACLPVSSTVSLNRSSCYTHSIIKKYLHTWTIDNFHFHEEENGKALESLTFPSPEEANDLRWRLELFPRGNREANKDHLSIFVHLISSGNKNADIQTVIEFSLLDAKNEVVHTKQTKRTFKMDDDKSWGYGQFVERKLLFEETDGLLPNDKLTIHCQVTVIIEHVSTLQSAAQVKVPNCQLVEEYSSLLESKKFSDITFIVQGSIVKAHKNILSARSPVFSAMFDHDMIEARDNRVDVPDIKHEVFCEMLRFIYTGESPKIDTMADELLAAADKYSLERLKVLCEEVICLNLRVENTADALVLSCLHSADQLRSFVFEFMLCHASEVIETESWKKLITSYPQYFVDAVSALASYISRNRC